MTSDKPRFDSFLAEIEHAFGYSRLSKADVITKLQERDVSHKRTSIEHWLNGRKMPPQSAIPALAEVLQLSYQCWKDVEFAYGAINWGRRSKSESGAALRTAEADSIAPGTPYLLHHVSVPVRDLQASLDFYTELLVAAPTERPNFPFAGAWLALPNGQQVHLVENRKATFRKKGAAIEPRDSHFALRVRNFTEAHSRLISKGIETLVEPFLIGSLQLYFHDPDRHVIEINAEYRGEPLK